MERRRPRAARLRTEQLRRKFMGVPLTKGGNVSLSKQAPGLTAVTVGLGWQAGPGYDLDASALLCGPVREGADRPALRVLQQPHQPGRFRPARGQRR
ncbi:hypothetical protein GCM10020221_21250 [Streptomyces thioluteus]|uniref:TerD domain-containing protein n=1 Tax=Streptomyces thioluteus TaxID=66431 RepID=A0ABN3WTH5_STRTU